jgi:hypothetical protein
VRKAVLSADALPVLRRHDAGSMICPILFKIVLYWGGVCSPGPRTMVEYWIHTGKLSRVSAQGHEFILALFAAIQIWIFVLLLIYSPFAS